MLGMFRPEPDTGAIREPQSPARRLFRWDFQAFASPDPFHPFVIDAPAIIPQQAGHLAIPIATILACKLDNRLGQRRFIIERLPLSPLCGARLAQHPTGSSFRDAQRGTAVLYGLPSARWA